MFRLKTEDGEICIERLESGCYELNFDIPSTIEKILLIAESLGKLNNRSFMEGSRNSSGILGEYLFFQIFRNKLEYVGNTVYDYDFISGNGRVTYDVKTKTQGVDVDPIVGKSEPFDASIPFYSKGMDCDKYVFLRVHKDFKKAWLIGWIEKDKYFSHENMKCLKKGKTDGWNKMEVRCNSANLKYKYLNSFDLTEKHFKQINSIESLDKSNKYLECLLNS